jgi:protein transport protein SEC31
VPLRQYGLIAGGLVDGTVNLWNPAKVLGGAGCEEPGDTTSGALLASLQKHAGGVRG